MIDFPLSNECMCGHGWRLHGREFVYEPKCRVPGCDCGMFVDVVEFVAERV